MSIRACSLLLFFSALFSLSVTKAGANPAMSAGPDFVLTQRSQKFGDQYSYISGKGFKLVSPRVGYSVVTRAPAWEIFMFNDKTHCYYATTAERWMHQVYREDGYDEFKGGQWKKTGTSTICGLKASVYTIKGVMGTHQANGLTISKNVNGATYVVYEGALTPPELSKLLTAGYSVPAVPGLPLRYTYQTNAGRDLSILETYRIDRCTASPGFFDRPNGYKLVQSQIEVMISPEQRELLNKLSRGSQADLGTKAAAELNKNAAGETVSVPANGQLGPQFSQGDANRLLEILKKSGN